MRANAPQLPEGGWAQLELTDALLYAQVAACYDRKAVLKTPRVRLSNPEPFVA